jgi:hypothetical protein
MIRASITAVKTLTCAALLALGACASAPPPDADLAAARASLLQAEPVAHRYARAELKLAQDKLARAEQAMTREDWREARRLAEQAEVDARYAWALAESERVRAER